LRVKPVIASEQARGDIDEPIAYFLSQGAARAALGFIDALERAFAHIGRHPGAGSSRYASELGLPGLRHWPLKNYPHLVFYVEHPDHIDVWRILHVARTLADLAGSDALTVHHVSEALLFRQLDVEGRPGTDRPKDRPAASRESRVLQ
jgi:toxin ParE1/3/4